MLFNPYSLKALYSTTHLKHRTHDPTFSEIRLEEMHHAPFCACCDVHQHLLVSDLSVNPMFLALEMFCAGKLQVELLKTLFSEVVEGGIIFQGVEKCVLVDVISVTGGKMGVKRGGDGRVEGCHWW